MVHTATVTATLQLQPGPAVHKLHLISAADATFSGGKKSDTDLTY